MTDSFCRQMDEEMKQIGISLSQEQMNQFYMYYEMLIEKNKVMNLTAITEESQVVTKHFVDSLSIVKAFASPDFFKNDKLSVIDVGTGAGFPGIPLKIVFPHIKLTLLDSLNKRIRFLEDVCTALKFTDVFCVRGRAEDTARDKTHRENYDLCVSRAVANMASLAEYCLPFVKEGGYFISYKSGEIQQELDLGKKAVTILGGSVEDVIGFSLPNSDLSRSLVKIKKIGLSPKKYPRKAGLPAREPIV